MSIKISIIMPVRNGSKYIAEALEHIFSQGVDCEVIVVDDGSDDDTVSIAEGYKCKVISHSSSLGPVAAKNTGLKAVSGDYVMFHDHDDVMREGVLSTLLSELEKDNGCAAVEAKVMDFHSPELTSAEKASSVIKEEPYYGLFTGAVLMRKEVWEVIGLFPENIKAGERILWQHKMDDNGLKIKRIDIVSTDRRIHSTNFGKTDRKIEFKDYAAILRMRQKNR